PPPTRRVAPTSAPARSSYPPRPPPPSHPTAAAAARHPPTPTPPLARSWPRDASLPIPAHFPDAPGHPAGLWGPAVPPAPLASTAARPPSLASRSAARRSTPRRPFGDATARSDPRCTTFAAPPARNRHLATLPGLRWSCLRALWPPPHRPIAFQSRSAGSTIAPDRG